MPVNQRSLANLRAPWTPETRPTGSAPRNCGATIREWLNRLAEKDLTAKRIRAIAKDKRAPWTKRAAAERILRTIEAGDLADMESLLNGTESLEQLRTRGVNTEVIKRVKVRTRTLKDGTVEVDREVELHDRAGLDVDRVINHTDGTPIQRSAVDATVKIQEVRIRVPGMPGVN